MYSERELLTGQTGRFRLSAALLQRFFPEQSSGRGVPQARFGTVLFGRAVALLPREPLVLATPLAGIGIGAPFLPRTGSPGGDGGTRTRV